MHQVQLPAEILAGVGDLKSEVQVVDAGGQVRGYLVSPEYRALVYEWIKTLFADEEELRQARAETGGYTTAEAIEYVRQLEAQYRGRA